MLDKLERNYSGEELTAQRAKLVEVYNRCENSNAVLMTIDPRAGIHPLLKILPVDWNCKISFGLLHSPKPSLAVQRLLNAFQAVYL